MAFRTILLLSFIVVTGCASNEIVKKESFSGYLPDYSKLQPVELDSNRVVLRWVNPALKQRTYKQIIIDPVSFYQERTQQKQLDSHVLKQIQQEIDVKIINLAKTTKLALTTKSGPSVLRLQSTIAAIKMDRKDFSVRELIPIKLLIAAIEAAAGGRDYIVTVYFEYKLIDSTTNEIMAIGVRKGKANTLANSKTKLTLNDMEDLLNDWEIDWETSMQSSPFKMK
ncbi:MAG: DUF3313 domain-containing protein [Ectothiorhodospiraceae bacterium]|nr:DUF3313 domain-containing protein [Ectothiorhodospiraceae bacterium]